MRYILLLRHINRSKLLLNPADFVKLFFWIFFTVATFVTLPTIAEPAPPQTAVTAPATPAAPSLKVVLEKIATFSHDKDELEARVKNLTVLGTVQTDFTDVAMRLQEATAELAHRQALTSWSDQMAAAFKQSVAPLFEDVGKIKSDYINFLQATEDVLHTLQEKRDFFQGFIDSVKADASLRAQKTAVQTILVTVDRLTSDIKTAREAYAKIYDAGMPVLTQAEKFEKKTQKEINFFKGNQFRKSAPAFFQSSFWTSVPDNLGVEIKQSIKSAFDFQSDWLSENRNNVFVVFLIVLVLGFVFKKLEGKARHDVQWLVFFYTLQTSMDTLGLPLVLYRFFLVVMASFLIGHCYLRIRYFGRPEHKNLFLSLIFAFLIFIFSGTILAEVFGYHYFAAFMTRGAIKSGFLVFVLWHLRFFFLHFVTSAINSFFDAFHLARRDRQLILKKTREVFHAFLIVSVFLLLAMIWGFFETPMAAAKGILSASFFLGKHEISLQMIVNAFVIYYVITSLAQIVALVLEEEVYPRKNISVGTGTSFNMLITYCCWIIAAFLAFTTLGFQLQQFAIIAGALSVGIGFGLQNLVNNFVSGLILLFERPIKVGDILDIDGQWGTVEKVGLRSTIIRSGSKTQIIIPNSDFITKKVENLTFSDPEYRVTIKVAVAYGSDLKMVKQLLIEIAESNPHTDHAKKPQVNLIELGGYALMFELWVWTDDVSHKREIVSEILCEIEPRFRAAGIEIPVLPLNATRSDKA